MRSPGTSRVTAHLTVSGSWSPESRTVFCHNIANYYTRYVVPTQIRFTSLNVNRGAS